MLLDMEKYKWLNTVKCTAKNNIGNPSVYSNKYWDTPGNPKLYTHRAI